MNQERWVLLGFAFLLVLLLIAWWVALSLKGEQPEHHHHTFQPEGKTTGIQISGGQLVAEIPERKERWVLQFASSHYDTDKKVATTKDGFCQVTRDGKVVTVFRAPTIIVRFKDREMEMRDGVTIVAMLPRLKVNLEALRWRWESGELVGTGKVKIEGERIRAVADRLEGDTTLQRISLIGSIRTSVIEAKSGERK
ncbi:MAG: hypothetical protein N3B10_07525 [Armatimonadetes bacterium]|nr:hypothetical protein [Armatimonadota bacterium]